MFRVLIIAYGNPLRCDDGLAWHAAQELSQLNLPGVEVIARHQLTPELALPASHAATVLFIDAAQAGVPGEIVSVPVGPEAQSSVFSHEFSPAAILSVAKELYGNCPEALVISMCGECFEHGETLSPTVRTSLPRLVNLVSGLARHLDTAPP